MDFAQLPLSYTGVVEAKHLDFLNHMNVMWYTHFFNEATWGFYNAIGFGRDYHQGDRGSFALEEHTRYLAELHTGDKFRIYSRAIARSAKLFHFMNFMIRDRDNELAATYEMLGVHIDMRTRRSAPMPAEMAKVWDDLILAHNRVGWDPPLNGSIRIK
jgi:acyl-CoA thioester hydrolase